MPIPENSDQDRLKQQAARGALEFVESGMWLGLGSGSTTRHFILLLGEALQAGKLHAITGVPTSKNTANLARAAGIPLNTLSSQLGTAGLPRLDLAVDGADEVDPRLNLIKGLGRAALREKIVETYTERLLIIVDESKLVQRLGEGPLPVEITPFEAELHVRWLEGLGCEAQLWREASGEPVHSDDGNLIVLCRFPNGILDPYRLSQTLSGHPGILGHGLFLDMATQVLVARASGNEILERKR
jgi:ribose 5-phosphate isomerase A